MTGARTPRPKSKTYSEAEITARLKSELPQWSYQDGLICRIYKTHGWKSTLMVAGAIAHLAEAAWHHPDLALSYSSAKVALSDHEAKGISDKDFTLAAMIERVVQWQPGKQEGPLEGTPQDDPRYVYLKYDV
jgi:4a-hydroxytetrahydrobiopterin dehydratase